MPNNASGQLFLSAPWLLPMDSEPIAHGVLVIEGDRIKAVLAPQKLQESPYAHNVNKIHYYANAVILPGLINLHSHLDYSALNCLSVRSSFYQWIKELIVKAQKWSATDWTDSAFYGASMAALTGTTFITDSSYSGAAAKAIASVGLRGIVGLELFGIDENEEKTKWDEWKIRMSGLEEADDVHLPISLKNGLLELTVAPHTPYSVCPRLWHRAKDWALERKIPVLAHLAESRQEYEWISATNHELDDFLAFAFLKEKIQTRDWSSLVKWRGHGFSPVTHLKRHDLLDENLLAAHVIQVDDDDLKELRDGGVKIAHCPRSNARLKAGYANLGKMLNLGLAVGLGTDSLASNNDLALLNEARFALNLHNLVEKESAYDSKKMLSMITIDAARAIRKEHLIGSLTVNKFADLAVFEFDERQQFDEVDPYDLVLHGQSKLKELIVGGKTIAKDGELTSACK